MTNFKILLVIAIITLAGSFGFAQEVTLQNSGTQDLLRAIVPVPNNNQELWLCATEKILHSTDSGDSWDIIQLDFNNIPDPESDYTGNKIYCGTFYDAYHGFFGGDRCLWEYNDGSFIDKSADIGYLNITSINYLSLNKIIIAGYDSNGKILLSEDGGDNWTVIFEYPYRSFFLGGDFYEDYGIIVGSRQVGTGFLGVSIETNDGGGTWTITNLPSGQLSHVEKINENIAIASANSGIVPLIKTTNNGDTWDTIPAYGGVIGLNVTSENEIFTTHNNYKVATTVNDGNDWDVIFGPDNTLGNTLFYDIYMNENFVWATGWYGTILRWDVESYKSMMYGASMGVDNIKDNNISIYPNPVKDYLNIDLNIDIEEINIFDITGKSVLHSKLGINKINLSFLEQGIYILNLKTSDGGQIVKKITKK